jgi:hypothetical protein
LRRNSRGQSFDDTIESGRQNARSIVGSGEDWPTKLSTAEFKDLLTLRDVALADQALIHASEFCDASPNKAESPIPSSILQRSGSNDALPAHSVDFHHDKRKHPG